MVQVRSATPADDEAVARLFAAYHEEYAYNLGDQDVAGEGRMARQVFAGGGVLVAQAEGQVVGCVCFEPWSPPRCRMRRMVVDPAWRGRGIGRALVEAVMDAARSKGFTRMCLDTTEPMQRARRLYSSMGFEPFEPDYTTPCRDVVFMQRRL